MKQHRLAITVVGAIWVAAVLQESISFKVGIFGIHPDFLLIVLTPVSALLPRPRAAMAGFFCGVLHGSMAGANLAHYIISRSIAGFFGAWARGIGFEVNATVMAATGVLLTLIAQTVWMFLAAPPGLASFLGDTIGSAMYNGVLAMLAYLLLRRILNPNARKGL
jgi:cell shape-determining protein MreD